MKIHSVMKNKHHILQTFKIAILALIALPMVACQTTGSAPGKAVMCDKCKTVWVSRPTSISAGTKGGPGYIVYRDVKSMECPECESAVATFFKTGSLQHRCKHCGGTMTHCESH